MADYTDMLRMEQDADDMAKATTAETLPEQTIATAIESLRLEIRALGMRLDYLYHDSKKR